MSTSGLSSHKRPRMVIQVPPWHESLPIEVQRRIIYFAMDHTTLGRLAQADRRLHCLIVGEFWLRLYEHYWPILKGKTVVVEGQKHDNGKLETGLLLAKLLALHVATSRLNRRRPPCVFELAKGRHMVQSENGMLHHSGTKVGDNPQCARALNQFWSPSCCFAPSNSEQHYLNRSLHTLVEPFMHQSQPDVVFLQPKTVSYFEMTVHDLPAGKSAVPGDAVAIGVTVGPRMRLNYHLPGWCGSSYGYHSDDGGIFVPPLQNAPLILPKQVVGCYGSGDTVGCGIDYRSKTVFFTRNGKVVGAPVNVPSRWFMLSRWYPVVGHDSVCPVSCNFGDKPFVYDLRLLPSTTAPYP